MKFLLLPAVDNSNLYSVLSLLTKEFPIESRTVKKQRRKNYYFEYIYMRIYE